MWASFTKYGVIFNVRAPDQFATTNPPTKNGHVVVWERSDPSSSKWTWSNNVTLASDAREGEGDLFGTSVALHEELLLIGSPHYGKHGAQIL
jgi:hypothetical protein